MSEDLKRCPFCGARGELYLGNPDTQYKGFAGVSCATDNTDNIDEYPDGCSIVPDTGWCASEELAIRVWNARATSIPDEVVERIAERLHMGLWPKEDVAKIIAEELAR